MLREEGAFPPVAADEPPYRQLIEGYCRFLRHDRGLAETTVANYRRYLRDFLVSLGAAVSPVELAALGADDLLAFSRQRGAGLGRTAGNHLATALSGFYRWLDMSGHGGAHLVSAVPSRRRYRLADVPCALSWEQVRRLLGMVDVREPNGRRNYAMLLLIASYGLRGCEVRALRLNDIDWAHDEIVIFAPKTGRRRVLPLTRPAGEAVLDYLLAERPPSRHREVFLSSRPPHGPLRSKINPWLGRQLDKAGIVTDRRGAHILRHSLAVHLLRSGETLKSIGDLLGHRRPDTTFIYTKLRSTIFAASRWTRRRCRDGCQPLRRAFGRRVRRLRRHLGGQRHRQQDHPDPATGAGSVTPPSEACPREQSTRPWPKRGWRAA